MMNAAAGIFLAARRNRAPTAKSYVQDGLVAMWDGIENAGWGVHDANATTWKDLTGNGHDWAVLTASFDDNSIAVTPGSCTLSQAVSQISCVEVGIKSFTASVCLVFFDNKKRIVCSSTRMTFTSLGDGFNVSGGYKTGSCVYSGDSVSKVYSDGVERDRVWWTTWGRGTNNTLSVADYAPYEFAGRIFFIRVYNRALTAEEIAANYAVDKARFNLP